MSRAISIDDDGDDDIKGMRASLSAAAAATGIERNSTVRKQDKQKKKVASPALFAERITVPSFVDGKHQQLLTNADAVVKPPALVEDEMESPQQQQSEQKEGVVVPGAVRVRGLGYNAGASLLSTAPFAFTEDDDYIMNMNSIDRTTITDQQQQQQPSSSPFVAVDVVTDEDIRREYFSQVQDEIIVSDPVKAEIVEEKKCSRLKLLWTCVIATVVIAAVITVVVIVQARNNRKGAASAASPSSSTPTAVSERETCDVMTDVLSSNSNWTSLKNETDAVSPTCEYIANDDGEVCTYYSAGLSSTTTRNANKLCSQLGGRYLEEDFTIQCNSSVGNQADYYYVANFKRNFVCVGATCNASQVQSYLKQQIVSRTQFLEEKEGKQDCQALYGTYRNSSLQQQQALFLPSIWGDQCAAEYNVIANNNNLTRWYNSTVLPSCQRNDTYALCTTDFTFEAAQIGPLCERIGGAFLTNDFQFQCTSQNGGIYVIKHLNQPVCTGVSCALSTVTRYKADVVRSNLVYQGYRNCELISSLTHQNISEHQLNQSLAVSSIGGTACAAVTAKLSSNSTLAALYDAFIMMSQVNTTDFTILATDAQDVCDELGGTYVSEDFAIGCDSSSSSLSFLNGGGDVYNFMQVFLCLGSICNASEIESYLEWPIVSQRQRLEGGTSGGGGDGQTCRVLYGSYVNPAVDYKEKYLPSVWGEKCAAEIEYITSNATFVLLTENSVILPTCDQQQQQQQQHERQVNCTTDFLGANTQIQALCPMLGGKYFESDFTFTCSAQSGSSTTYILEYVHFAHCTGISCNVNQSAAATAKTYKTSLISKGFENCQLVSQDEPYYYYYQNASDQQKNVSAGGNDEQQQCTLQTNLVSTNAEWAVLNSQSYLNAASICDSAGNALNCTIDYSTFVASGKTLCRSLGGQYAEVNFTVRDCFQSDLFLTNSYVFDFFCLGLSCNVTQSNLYLEGAILVEILGYNCSQDLTNISYVTNL